MGTDSSSSSTCKPPLTAFVSFPSPYTQTLLVQALVSTLPAISLSLIPPSEDDPPALQWADYDLLSFEKPHEHPTEYLTSSYVYRKALIRKHQLHLTITEYLAKCQHRGIRSVLAEGGVPKGWVVELQFADELEEAMMDDLYELGEALRENEERQQGERRWFILKPGFADRAQGIRMFSTQDELQRIFEAFEPSSSDEEDEDEDDNEENEEQSQTGNQRRRASMVESETSGRPGRCAEETFEDLERRAQGLEVRDEDEEDGTRVMTSQLRHFVIQEYVPRSVLFDIHQLHEDTETSFTGYKFHLRAYVLLTGDYTLHLSRVMLALFSGSPYVHPSTASQDEGEIDLRPHLTNTCLQTDAFGAPTPPAELVKLFWELEGLDALSEAGDGKYRSRGKVSRDWLDDTFAKVAKVIAESVKAGVECGSFGLQLVPNAFEIFGVDLLCSFQESTSDDLPIPTVTLLEYNASPDFHQSGDRLKSELLEMFKGVVRISVAPFFDIELEEDDKEGQQNQSNLSRGAPEEVRDEGEGVEMRKFWEMGEEMWGWRLIGKGQVRGHGPG